MPTRLAPLLESMGHQVDTVADEGLTGKPDTDVWIAAQKKGRFGDWRKYPVWPKVNPSTLRQGSPERSRRAQDERIYFYKALLSEVEGTLNDERGFVCAHCISHIAPNLFPNLPNITN